MYYCDYYTIIIGGIWVFSIRPWHLSVPRAQPCLFVILALACDVFWLSSDGFMQSEWGPLCAGVAKSMCASEMDKDWDRQQQARCQLPLSGLACTRQTESPSRAVGHQAEPDLDRVKRHSSLHLTSFNSFDHFRPLLNQSWPRDCNCIWPQERKCIWPH